MTRAVRDRVCYVHQELGEILADAGMAARLPQALLERLQVLRNMLTEEMNNDLRGVKRVEDVSAQAFTNS